MSISENCERILQTIDQLKRRKTRPDDDRIIHMVNHQHGMTSDEAKACLESLVDQNLVIKVTTKGIVSYRCAANPPKKKHPSALASKSKCNRTGRRVLKAVRSLTKTKSKRMAAVVVSKPRPRGRPPKGKSKGDDKPETSKPAPVANYQEVNGVSQKQIENFYRRKWVGEDNNLQNAIEKEVASGRLLKLPNGKFTLKNWSHRDSTASEDNSTLTADPESSSGAASGTSSKPSSENTKKSKFTGSQRKKLKKDPSMEDELCETRKLCLDDSAVAVDAAQELLPISEVDTACETCKQAAFNALGQPEDLLICKDCNLKVHPSCLSYKEALARRALQSPWQCYNCKSCQKCLRTDEAGYKKRGRKPGVRKIDKCLMKRRRSVRDKMLFCDSCDKGYHIDCHYPPNTERPNPEDDWVCQQCLTEQDEATTTTCQEPMEISKAEVDTGGKEEEEEEEETSSQAADAGGGASCLPTPSDSPAHFTDDAEEDVKEFIVEEPKRKPHPLPQISHVIAGDAPIATEWSVEEVSQYFHELGFIIEAPTFREQEIDGRALLMMTRNDVISNTGFLLGPALKIHQVVKWLQEKALSS